MRDAEPDTMSDAGDASLDAASGTLDASETHDAAQAMDAAPIPCLVQAPTSCPSPEPHYSDVAPIFRERCVICHAPTWNGPWPLDQYEHVSDWQDTIHDEVLHCLMPPPEAGVPITLEERTQILTWLRCGLPM